MLRLTIFLFLFSALSQPAAVSPATEVAAEGPNYTANGELKMPERYREWIFLTSGVDMSYSPDAASAGHSVFDNVFVNPSAYRAFQTTGTWPDKTTMVLEVRGAEGPISINKRDTRSRRRSRISRSTSRTPNWMAGGVSINLTPGGVESW
jgi:hypothetical protein